MRENSKKNMPDIMEAIFDAGYLIFDLIAGILFFVFSKGNLFVYPLRSTDIDTLWRRCFPSGAKDHQSCPRAVHGSSERIRKQLGIGLQVSSITMTVFYIILLYVWKLTFPGAECTGSSGSNDLDLCDHQDRGMLPSSE